jgi:hypothetical protein
MWYHINIPTLRVLLIIPYHFIYGCYIFGILNNAQFQYRIWGHLLLMKKGNFNFYIPTSPKTNMYSGQSLKRKASEYTPSLYVRLADTWVLVQKSANCDCSQRPSGDVVLALLLNQFQVPWHELLLVGSRKKSFILPSPWNLCTFNTDISVRFVKKILLLHMAQQLNIKLMYLLRITFRISNCSFFSCDVALRSTACNFVSVSRIHVIHWSFSISYSFHCWSFVSKASIVDLKNKTIYMSSTNEITAIGSKSLRQMVSH